MSRLVGDVEALENAGLRAFVPFGSADAGLGFALALPSLSLRGRCRPGSPPRGWSLPSWPPPGARGLAAPARGARGASRRASWTGCAASPNSSPSAGMPSHLSDRGGRPTSRLRPEPGGAGRRRRIGAGCPRHRLHGRGLRPGREPRAVRARSPASGWPASCSSPSARSRRPWDCRPLLRSGSGPSRRGAASPRSSRAPAVEEPARPKARGSRPPPRGTGPLLHLPRRPCPTLEA